MFFKIITIKLKIFNSNGNNPVWAYESLDYMIFIQHKDEFYALSEYDQWQVRDMMIALKKIYQ